MEKRLISDLKTVTFGLIVPFFFVFVGLNFDFKAITAFPFLFVLILAVAITGKLVGALLSAFSAKLTFQQSMLIGWGMNSRGAVELVIAEVARQAGLIPIEIYSSIVAMAIITTIIFPIVLKFYMKKYRGIME
jgi:Kef-type K+ transport system membrane component KefB